MADLTSPASGSLADAAKAHLLPALIQGGAPDNIARAIAQIYSRFHMPPPGGATDQGAVQAMAKAAGDPDDHGAFLAAAGALSPHDRRALAMQMLQDARNHPDPVMVYDRLTDQGLQDKIKALGVVIGGPGRSQQSAANAQLSPKAKALASSGGRAAQAADAD